MPVELATFSVRIRLLHSYSCSTVVGSCLFVFCLLLVRTRRYKHHVSKGRNFKLKDAHIPSPLDDSTVLVFKRGQGAN